MFHQDGNNDVDQDKLGHQDEADEVNGGQDGTGTAVFDAVGTIIAFFFP